MLGEMRPRLAPVSRTPQRQPHGIRRPGGRLRTSLAVPRGRRLPAGWGGHLVKSAHENALVAQLLVSGTEPILRKVVF